MLLDKYNTRRWACQEIAYIIKDIRGESIGVTSRDVGKALVDPTNGLFAGFEHNMLCLGLYLTENLVRMLDQSAKVKSIEPVRMVGNPVQLAIINEN